MDSPFGTQQFLLDGIRSVPLVHSTPLPCISFNNVYTTYTFDALIHPLSCSFTRPRAHQRPRRSLQIPGHTTRAREGIAAERPIHQCFRGSLFTTPDIYLFLKWTLSARACPPTYELIYCSSARFSHPLFACLDCTLYLRRGRRGGWV